jgi:hypothetical protein
VTLYWGAPHTIQSRTVCRSLALIGGEPAGGMVQVSSWPAMLVNRFDTSL